MIDYTPKKKVEKITKFSTKSFKLTVASPVKSGYVPRESSRIASRVTDGGSTAKRETMSYTGSEMIGITILHKSCLQPVFSRQEAVDAASMRR